jgi:hypothetical protein
VPDDVFVEHGDVAAVGLEKTISSSNPSELRQRIAGLVDVLTT